MLHVDAEPVESGVRHDLRAVTGGHAQPGADRLLAVSPGPECGVRSHEGPFVLAGGGNASATPPGGAYTATGGDCGGIILDLVTASSKLIFLLLNSIF